MGTPEHVSRSPAGEVSAAGHVSSCVPNEEARSARRHIGVIGKARKVVHRHRQGEPLIDIMNSEREEIKGERSKGREIGKGESRTYK